MSSPRSSPASTISCAVSRIVTGIGVVVDPRRRARRRRCSERSAAGSSAGASAGPVGGLLAAAFLAIAPPLDLFGYQVIADTPALALMVLALGLATLSAPAAAVAAGVVFAASLSVKLTAVTVVPALLWLLRRRLVPALAGFGVVAVALLLAHAARAAATCGRATSRTTRRHVRRPRCSRTRIARSSIRSRTARRSSSSPSLAGAVAVVSFLAASAAAGRLAVVDLGRARRRVPPPPRAAPRQPSRRVSLHARDRRRRDTRRGARSPPGTVGALAVVGPARGGACGSLRAATPSRRPRPDAGAEIQHRGGKRAGATDAAGREDRR